MGRPSNRDERRAEIIRAFSRVLADHGFAGATIAAVAQEAGITPGLIHHHFSNKEELLTTLLQTLMSTFRGRVATYEEGGDPLLAYIDGALALDDTADVAAARCWVGLFAEAVRNQALFKRFRRLLDTEIEAIQRRSDYDLSTQDAGAILAFIIGSLVIGAFAPRKTTGFAAPALKTLVATLRSK